MNKKFVARKKDKYFTAILTSLTSNPPPDTVVIAVQAFMALIFAIVASTILVILYIRSIKKKIEELMKKLDKINEDLPKKDNAQDEEKRDG